MKKELKVFIRKDRSHGVIKDILNIGMFFILIMIMSGMFENYAHAQTITDNSKSYLSIRNGDEWRYFKGVEAPPREWTRNGFDDAGWPIGPSGFGYGIGSNRTYVEDMRGNYSTVYARREFTINNPDTLTGMSLSVVCDGPFIAYLNGIEIIRTNTIAVSSPSQTIVAPQAERFNISGFVHELTPGINVLSVQCDNDDINSEDFSFVPFFEIVEIGGIQ